MEINSFDVLKPLGGGTVFHQNLDLTPELPNALPSFYKNLLSHWCENFSHYPDSKGEISSKYIWYNKYIQIAVKPVFFRALEERGIKHISDLFFAMVLIFLGPHWKIYIQFQARNILHGCKY